MIFFTSDTHFYHMGVLMHCPRPWTTIEDMNAGLIANWNACVAPDDTVYHLGDIALCGMEKAAQCFRQLNGHKILIVGNHDVQNKFYKELSFDLKKMHEKRKIIPRWKKLGFEQAMWTTKILIDNKAVNLSHFPYKGRNPDARVFENQLVDRGDWLICGHVHHNWKYQLRTINVGVDMWDYKPVSITQITEAIQQRHDLKWLEESSNNARARERL